MASPVATDEWQVAQTASVEPSGVSGVAGRYASALFELARDENAIDQVSRDLVAFNRLIQDNPDLARLVRSPVFTAEQQVAAVTAILARAGIAGLAANLIRLVAGKRRLFVLPDMIRDFEVLRARARGIVPAQVRLAEEPSPLVLNEIKTALREMAGAEVDVSVKIDPALIGGMVVQIGSRMVDASLKTKLNTIRLAMKEAR
jgi:F-type H+-transporting ATPase subunit delta